MSGEGYTQIAPRRRGIKSQGGPGDMSVMNEISSGLNSHSIFRGRLAPTSRTEDSNETDSEETA